MKLRQRWILTTILAVMVILFTVAVKTIDVQTYGIQCPGINCFYSFGVGFSKINFAALNALGSSEIWDKATDIVMLAVFSSGLIFAIMGAYQLFKRKKLLKVDWEILMLGIVYVLLGIFYVLFEKVIVNYRPTLVDGELGASFPSSHMMMVVTVAVTVMMILPKYIKNIKMRSVIDVLLTIMIILMVIGRLLSGMHWLTDIIAGFLYSALLISLYDNLLKIKEKE